MTDRRRITGPVSGTSVPTLDSSTGTIDVARQHRARWRGPRELRKIFLQTGLTPSASGSAYLELRNQPGSHSEGSTLPRKPALKLTCTVHGPKLLPRSTPFTSNMLLSTYVKFAPFAVLRRHGYLRDNVERDLGVHLETALRGVIITDRWPKSGLDVVITILEGGDNSSWPDNLDHSPYANNGQASFGLMAVLSGCITAASAAIIDAGIDCVDVVSGGLAAIVPASEETLNDSSDAKPAILQLVLDPCPSEHKTVLAACVVGYLKARDEITELWIRGAMPLSSEADNMSEPMVDTLIGGAVKAAIGYSHTVESINKEALS